MDLAGDDSGQESSTSSSRDEGSLMNKWLMEGRLTVMTCSSDGVDNARGKTVMRGGQRWKNRGGKSTREIARKYR